MAQIEGNPKPPYLSYKTFDGVMNFLGRGLPTRIDKSLFLNHSGAIQGQIISALKYLGLIHDDGTPSQAIKKWVDSEEGSRPEVLSEILRGQYKFVFSDSFDLEKATTGQLEESFRDQGVTGDTVRKGIAFFLQACEAANIPVSPHIKRRGSSSSANKKRNTAGGNSIGKGSSPKRTRSRRPKKPAQNMEEMLLAKFPEFDPAWPPEQQKKWFDAFKIFQRQILPIDGDESPE